MLVESLGASLVIGKARGGKFSSIKDAEIYKWYLIVLAFFIEFASIYLSNKGYIFFRNNILFIHLISYCTLFAALYFNREKASFRVIFIGVLLNFIVIIANGGRMPVSADALIGAGLFDNLKALESNSIITHTIADANTKFRFLADIFLLGNPYPRPKVFSIGDVVMAIGVFMYIQEIMLNRKNINN